jgi:hypothetical protein
MTKVIEKSKTQFFTRNPLLKEECIKNSSSSAGLEIEFVKMKTVMEKLEREIELLKIINLGQKLIFILFLNISFLIIYKYI